MSDKQTITIAVIGPNATGKTAIAGLIAKTLHDKGFDIDVQLQGVGGSDRYEKLHDSLTEARILAELPAKTQVFVTEAARGGDVKVAPNAQPKIDRSPEALEARLIVPVWTEERKNHFIDTGRKTIPVRLEGGVTVQTLPLKIGARVDVLGLSTTREQLDQGLIDETDRIDTVGAMIDTLVFKTSSGQFVKAHVGGAAFNAEGSTRTLTLSSKVSVTVPLHRDNHDIFGELLKKPEHAHALLDVVLEGQIQLDLGTVEVHCRGLRVDSLLGNGANFAPPDKLLTLEGFILRSYRINPNRRPR